MSGIVGLVDRGQGIEAGELANMHDQIAHRGPDGSQTWCDDAIGMGHQLLASTPEAQYDDQPVRDGALVVTADARIDNRGELLETLPVSAAETPIPDSELLLAAYREWGEQCVDHLIGAFAFAVWDGDTGTLLCARDHVGVKPLYYHRGEDVFAFASEQKCLLALSSVPQNRDETKVGDFLVGLSEDTQRTFYDAIDRLPPAHAMTVSADGIERWQYWDLDPTRTITLESDAAYERRFRELLEEAVRCRLRAPGPVGTALSGGMDSSSITVLARELLPSQVPLHTFSNVFDDAPSSDEREFIETVIDREGITPHYLFMDDVGSLVDLEDVLAHYDQPPHNTMHFARWEKAKYAADAGIDVVLGGALGDSAVGYGLGFLPELVRTGRWRRLADELRAMGEVTDAPPRHLFVRHGLSPLVPEPIKRGRKRLRGRAVLAQEANPTVDAAFADRIGLQSRYRELTAGGSVFRRSARRTQHRSLTAGTNAANFETSDLTNAAFGIETRYPFTDIRLLEFSLAIPPSQQLKDGWTRSILRRSLDDLLPEKIQWRPWKTMMNEGFWNALSREDERLRAIVDDPGPLDRYLDTTALEETYERFSDDPSSRDARALWRALSLSVWLDDSDSATSKKIPDRSVVNY
ncbi:asparagine synthase (glutamine-hydrolyzing) [Natronoglomus mannanivorans]|uniref:Putative asparagine synthetase [glutamine-hydrolyzing] n=1 Tax=Natronoglomus mannanivorans TaxID=2979990 RepID=A0AAP2Z1U4_9EURY|nr:asparagine synthase (glutamine-hydrolyzing) [Halobacteria archaeon AArc-xg1-1]